LNFTVGLTKLAFMQEILVQNFKNSNTRIFVYKYLRMYCSELLHACAYHCQ
jgi:hypothetical protein